MEKFWLEGGKKINLMTMGWKKIGEKRSGPWVEIGVDKSEFWERGDAGKRGTE